MPISQRSIAEVRDRASIIEVVSRLVQLKPRGRDFWGLSPFKTEKTPSFHVRPEMGVFKCFSTGEAGDVIRFVQLTEGLQFQEAVEALADRFHVTLEYEGGRGPSRETRSLRRRLIELHDWVAERYHRFFLDGGPEGKAIRSYWEEERGFKLETARAFRIGFAPADGGDLGRALLKAGFTVDEITRSGLFFDRQRMPDPSRWLARFRGRLMIPIRDRQGQVVAFTARQLSVTPVDDPTREAKYVNSPETEIFIKSRLLFNLDRAREAGTKEGRFLLVEGQLDAVRCWECGLLNAVAPQGTAVTDDQMRLLRRYASQVEVLLDGDEAGRRAALRVLPLALRSGLEPSYLMLEPGMDPDLFLRRGGSQALNALPRISAMGFACETLLEGGTPSVRASGEALLSLFEILAEADLEVVRMGYLKEAATRLAVDPLAAERDFAAFQSRRRGTGGRRPVEKSPRPNEDAPARLTTLEGDLLYLVLHHAELVPEVAKVVDPEWISHDQPEGLMLARMLFEVREGQWDGPSCWDAFLTSDEERRVYFHLLTEERPLEDPVRQTNSILAQVYRKHAQKCMEELDRLAGQSPFGSDAWRLHKARKLDWQKSLLHPPVLSIVGTAP